MSDFRNHLAHSMEDHEFAAEFEAMRPEYEAVRAIIGAKIESGITQKEFAEQGRESYRKLLVEQIPD